MKQIHRLQYAAQAYAHARRLLDKKNPVQVLVDRATVALVKESQAYLDDIDNSRITRSSSLNTPYGSVAHVESFLSALEEEAKKEKLFVVRLYDGFDNQWCDVAGPIPKEEAERILAEKTGNGTHHVNFSDIDYYSIFPADTKMLYSDGFGEH